MTLPFPKPGDIKREPVAVRVFADGKERCNLLTKEGRDTYRNRTRMMWERQSKICCLYGHIKTCPGKLFWQDATFDHETPRGHGGGSRDDRIEVPMIDGKTGKIVVDATGQPKMKWQNGAAHNRCNIEKGSRRIHYNEAHNYLSEKAQQAETKWLLSDEG